MRRYFLFIGLLLLFAIEILRVYFIMPFPGSQRSDSVGFAWFLNNNMLWLRILGLILALPPLFYFLRKGKRWQQVLLTVLILF